MADEIREIGEIDIPPVVALLQEGFPREPPDYWATVLRVLGSRPRPEGTEKYGYLLLVDEVARGVILTIPSAHRMGEQSQVFVNVSSWYVQPPYRQGRSRPLYARATQRPDVTYTNLSPAAHTIAAITECGFEQWTAGQMAAVALRGRPVSSPRQHLLSLERAGAEGLSDADVLLLSEHQELGCLAFGLKTPAGVEPLIFLKRRIKGLLPCAQLALCRNATILSEFGHEITTGLWRRGYAMMIVDCSAPIDGFQGRYLPGRRTRYYRGARPPQFVDHSYSEMVFLPGVI